MWILLELGEPSKQENMQNHNKQSSEDHNRRAVKAIYEGYYSASWSCCLLKYAANNRRHPVNSGFTPANIATPGRFSKTLMIWVPPPVKVKCLSLCIFYVTESLLCWFFLCKIDFHPANSSKICSSFLWGANKIRNMQVTAGLLIVQEKSIVISKRS